MGFNGGSGLAANERAVMAILVTQIAAAAGTISWMAAEWISRGKPSLLGMISGAVAGLVAITPASGFVAVSYTHLMTVNALKKKKRYQG